MEPLNLSRRQVLPATAAALATQVSSTAQSTKLSMPGLYRGRVVAVHHPASIVNNAFGAEPIKQMIERGMTALTGASDLRQAWKQFVEPGDVVGIKVNPVGAPHVISSAEVLREI